MYVGGRGVGVGGGWVGWIGGWDVLGGSGVGGISCGGAGFCLREVWGGDLSGVTDNEGGLGGLACCFCLLCELELGCVWWGCRYSGRQLLHSISGRVGMLFLCIYHGCIQRGYCASVT